MNRLLPALLLLALLGLGGGYYFWLSTQSLAQQHRIAGRVATVSKNVVRRKSAVHYALEIRLRGRPEIFLVPVRYEPAIPAIVAQVQPGDSIAAYYPSHLLPRIGNSIELTHLICHGNVLLDFFKVQALRRRIAIICAIGVMGNVALLLLASRKKPLGRWFRNSYRSRRFFA